MTPKYRIVDSRWSESLPGFVIALLIFGGVFAGLLLFANPRDGRLTTQILYYGLFAIAGGLFIGTCYFGFTYRYTVFVDDGVVVHDAWYGLRQRRRKISSDQIRAVECCDSTKKMNFGATCSTTILQLRLIDDTTVILAEAAGAGRFRTTADKLRALVLAASLPGATPTDP